MFTHSWPDSKIVAKVRAGQRAFKLSLGTFLPRSGEIGRDLLRHSRGNMRKGL